MATSTTFGQSVLAALAKGVLARFTTKTEVDGWAAKHQCWRSSTAGRRKYPSRSMALGAYCWQNNWERWSCTQRQGQDTYDCLDKTNHQTCSFGGSLLQVLMVPVSCWILVNSRRGCVVAILRCRQFMESFIQFLWSSGVVMVSLMGLWRITFCSVSEAHIFSLFCW